MSVSQKEHDGLVADLASARQALSYYSSMFCEGWCAVSDVEWEDCSGCLARRTLAALDSR